MRGGFIFVGEKPSRLAYDRGWSWYDGKLAAKPLFEALATAQIDPLRCGFVNLFGNHPDDDDRNLTGMTMARGGVLAAAGRAGVPIVALGSKVSKALTQIGVRHVQLTHPAARGKIRASEAYAAHVREIIGKALA